MDAARGGILLAVERICPFLALESDGHAVVAGYDPEHRCGALLPHEPIERQRQLATCLEPAHTACPRYLAAIQVRREEMPWAPPSPDVDLLSTRLVLGPESALRALSAGARHRGRRWTIGLAAALVLIVAAAGGVLGTFGSLNRPAAERQPAASADHTPSVDESVAPAIGGRPTSSVPAATAAATPLPTSTPELAESDPPSISPNADRHTYVVREGDTLGDIAANFGTSVESIMAANDLEKADVILVGQELVVP